MFKHLLWILPFFVLLIAIEPYCCYLECCFYLPPSFLGMYNLSTSALGCNILCMFNRLRVFVSIFFSSEIFQSCNDAKTIFYNWDCKDIDCFYFVSPIELSSKNQSYSPKVFLSYFSFILLCWIPSLSSTPRFLYIPS